MSMSRLPPATAAQMMVDREMQRWESDVSAAKNRIRVSKSINDIRRALESAVPGHYIRSLAPTLTLKHQLERDAEEAAYGLGRKRLADLVAEIDPRRRERLLQDFRAHVLAPCRGRLAAAFRKLERDMHEAVGRVSQSDLESDGAAPQP
jgi:hypothetical protein